MTWKRWSLLAAAAAVLWITVVYTLDLSYIGLLVATGFFIGRACAARKIEILEGKLHRARQRQEITTEFLSAAADKLVEINTVDAGGRRAAT